MLVGGATQIGIGRASRLACGWLIRRSGDIRIELRSVTCRTQLSCWASRNLGRRCCICLLLGGSLIVATLLSATLLSVWVCVSRMGLRPITLFGRALLWLHLILRRCLLWRCLLRPGVLLRCCLLLRGSLLRVPGPGVGINIITTRLRHLTCGQRL